jgi:hypothetical protein
MTDEHAPYCEIAFSHCTCGRGDSEPKPAPLGLSLQEALGGVLSRDPSQGASEAQKPRVWLPGDLWHGVPEEFRGATLSDGLKKALNEKPVSFALVGPPGTGKTRSLWAMLHSLRVRTMAEAMGSPVDRMRIAQGEYSSRRETVDEAISRELVSSDRLEIITEVGDIRANRYDRAVLDCWASTERWLAVDDIGAMEPNEWVREAIYHMANERRAHSRTTIWTSNLSPQKIRDTFGGAIASRILGGAVIETSGADRRMA